MQKMGPGAQGVGNMSWSYTALRPGGGGRGIPQDPAETNGDSMMPSQGFPPSLYHQHPGFDVSCCRLSSVSPEKKVSRSHRAYSGTLTLELRFPLPQSRLYHQGLHSRMAAPTSCSSELYLSLLHCDVEACLEQTPARPSPASAHPLSPPCLDTEACQSDSRLERLARANCRMKLVDDFLRGKLQGRKSTPKLLGVLEYPKTGLGFPEPTACDICMAAAANVKSTWARKYF